MFTLKQLLTMLCSDEDGQTWTKSVLVTAVLIVGVLTLLSIVL
jgi:hypothetical protein